MTDIPLAVTTSVKPAPDTEAQARALAEELGAPFVPRLARALPLLLAAAGAARLLVAAADRLRLHDAATRAAYFFHPNMFLVRGSAVLHGQPDHFLEATGLGPGDRLLDCTLGFASEASLAALAVGAAGVVVGLESEPALAAVTRIGLQAFPMSSRPLAEAMRRVRVVRADHRAYLAACDTGAFDSVYFDPFFPERLSGSEASVSPLFVFGNPAPLDAGAVMDALRVARRRVVIKHPRAVPLPPPLPDMVAESVGSRKSRVVYSVLRASL